MKHLFLSALSAASLACAQQAPELLVSVGTPELFTNGASLFSDRAFTALDVPPALRGAHFLRAPISASQTLTCSRAGTLYALTPAAHPENSLAGQLRERGFEQLPGEPFQLFGTQAADKAVVFRKTLAPGESVEARKWVLFAACGDLRVARPRMDRRWRANDGETLPNGIRLPRVWPPRYLDPASDEPMEAPYLDAPPALIPVDLGRQLFVDDFLIESTDLARTFHTATKYEGNPVFKPATSNELAASSAGERGQKAVCYLGHGGVFYDPAESLYKMWYTAGWRGPLALATSPDAAQWHRPALGPAGNVVFPAPLAGGDNCAWLDLDAPPAERVKFLSCYGPVHKLFTSPDGRLWSKPLPAGGAGDYCSFFFNPFRGVWVYSVKRGNPRGRCRYYAESPLFMTEGAFNSSVYWCCADRLDEPDAEARCLPQLYSLSAVAYESLLLGVFQIHLGPPNEACDKGKFPKITELKLGFSRDGFHWHRPDRRAFIPAARKEGAWDRAYLHTTAGVCLVDGDRLLFPYCGYSGVAPDGTRGMYTGGSVGLATLRRDGFASLDAGPQGGTLTTRPITFTGRHLFVNAACTQGALRAEVLDAATSEPLGAPLSAERFDSPRIRLGDVQAFAGKPVRLRFRLTSGSLFSFWASPSESGASRGYLAAGSPGSPSIVDTD
jgi:hypothetical protein